MKDPKDITPDTIFIIAPMNKNYMTTRDEMVALQKRIEDKGKKTISFYDLFSPLTEDDYPDDRSHWRKAIAYLVMCDTVITLPRWESDVVATQNVNIARVIQTKVIQADKFLLDLDNEQKQ